jgi:hypothetical protein
VLRLIMATPGIADDRSDGAPVYRSTTPTGVADFDFALPVQGDDDDAWAQVNTPLHKASYLWKTHTMQEMQKMQGALVYNRVLRSFNQMDKERNKYKQKMVHFLEVFASFPGFYRHRQRQFFGCTCLKQLVNFNHAADFLVNVGMMNKGEQ